MAKLISINPSNGKRVGEVEISSKEEIRSIIKKAQKAKSPWKEIGTAKRIELLKPIYKEFSKKQDALSLLISKEMGTAISECRDTIAWDMEYFSWFLENGENALQEEVSYEDETSVHKVIYEPIGVAAVIVPWNFPFEMFLWGVIPNLIAGNTVVFKHSEECPLTGKLIEEVMRVGNLPEGVFSEIYGDGKTGEALVNDDIDLIWFTGSSAVGKHLYEIAGKKFIKSVMELGGSNPTLVFDDVKNIDEIIPRIFTKRFLNCGQACDALKRLLVQESIFDEVVEKLKNLAESKKVGVAEDTKTDIGPLVAQRQVDLLEAQINDAIRKGAKVITGGRKPVGLNGSFYMPTILKNIKKDMRVWNEETFGPLLIVVPFKSEKDAIELANNTSYGLGAQIYTNDKNRARRLALKINAGSIDINKASHWFACNPFGGYKDSGMGREHGKFGFYELTQVKVISEEK